MAFVLRRQWFTFGEERFVAMGEMLDLVDPLAAAMPTGVAQRP